MKTQECQSLVARPFYRANRKDSAACVSLSSYHNVKEPVGVQRRATLPNPQWKQIPHLESTTAGASREDPSKLRLCPKGSRGRVLVSQVMRATPRIATI